MTVSVRLTLAISATLSGRNAYALTWLTWLLCCAILLNIFVLCFHCCQCFLLLDVNLRFVMNDLVMSL